MEASCDSACDSSLFWMLYFHIALTLHMSQHYSEAAEVNCATAVSVLSSHLSQYLLQCIEVLSESAPDSTSYGAALYFYCVECSILAEEQHEQTDYITYISTCLTTAWAAAPHFEMLCLFVRGKAYQRMQKHKEAIEDFDAAIALQQNDANAYIYFRRGWSHKVFNSTSMNNNRLFQAVKQFAAAGTDFETAKQLRPHDPNFSVDYKHVNNIEYIVVRTEPDVVEPFLPILEAVKSM